MPGGMVHAIGGGIVLYEIQQSSDVTYRVWDYGRVNDRGEPRELHIRQALDVIDPRLAGRRARWQEEGEAGIKRALHLYRKYFVADANCSLILQVGHNLANATGKNFPLG